MDDSAQQRLFAETPGSIEPPEERLYLGTSGWSYADWEGTLYPEGLPSGSRLAEYVKRYATVEIDSSFYGTPRRSTVQKWREISPEGFLFAAKFPQEITHEKNLVGCEREAESFVRTMTDLGDRLERRSSSRTRCLHGATPRRKNGENPASAWLSRTVIYAKRHYSTGALGPLLVQLPPSFTVEGMGVLEDFLKNLPNGFRYAVEVRHRSWLGSDLSEMLRERGVALTLIDYPRMPRMHEATADFSYIRWLGDRREFPEGHTHLKKEREEDLRWWSEVVGGFLEEGRTVFAYANNHYQNHSPSTLERFLEIRRGGR